MSTLAFEQLPQWADLQRHHLTPALLHQQWHRSWDSGCTGDNAAVIIVRHVCPTTLLPYATQLNLGFVAAATAPISSSSSPLLHPNQLEQEQQRKNQGDEQRQPLSGVRVRVVDTQVYTSSEVVTATGNAADDVCPLVHRLWHGFSDKDAATIEQLQHPTPDVVLLEVHGSENGGDELGVLRALVALSSSSSSSSKLVVIVHRPEEFILRTAHTLNVSVDDARVALTELLSNVITVVLLESAVRAPLDYAQMCGGRVVALPHGAFGAAVVDDDFVASRCSVVVVGSATTWGEMRDICDVQVLLRHVRRQLDVQRSAAQQLEGVRVLGFVAGKFDRRSNVDAFCRNTEEFVVVRCSDIVDAAVANSFRWRTDDDEQTTTSSQQSFREWLLHKAGERIVIRPDSFAVDGGGGGDNDDTDRRQLRARLHNIENTLVDFNVQMYKENVDVRALRASSQRKEHRVAIDAAKYEASGTLHKGKAEIFVVSDSDCVQRDIVGNEGYRMIRVMATAVPTKATAAAVATHATPEQLADTTVVAAADAADRAFDFCKAATDIVELVATPAERLAWLQHNSRVSGALGMREVAHGYGNVFRTLLAGGRAGGK